MNAKRIRNGRRLTALLLCLLLMLSGAPLQALSCRGADGCCYLYRPYKCRCCDYL